MSFNALNVCLFLEAFSFGFVKLSTMAQSKAELTSDKQMFYLVQWFAEFSDFQRTDFLKDHLLPLYREFLKGKLFVQDAFGENGMVETKIANKVSSIGKF